MVPAPEFTHVIPPFPYSDLLERGPFNDWRDDLRANGFAIIPAIPRARALEYRQKALGWLEAFGLGFDRTKPETFVQEKLPVHYRGGMYIEGYGLCHEQWVWDLRTEPGVLGAFEKLWGTKELVTSFDAGAIMLPPPEGRELKGDDLHWEHIDQNPSRVGFFCAQGLVNLNDNGPLDGGLLAMKGSSLLLKEFFDVHGRPPVPEGRIDWHMFSLEDKKWFEDKGCEWLKVCASPGDLILWDSRVMHQNTPPTRDVDRIVTYICMGPAELMTDEDKAMRARAWKEQKGTTHTPFMGAYCREDPPMVRPETGKPCPVDGKRIDPVRPTDQILKLAGVVPY